MKSIILDTESVQAILDGRKSVVRLPVKHPALYRLVISDDDRVLGSFNFATAHIYPTIDDCRYQPGDTLYVRETWKKVWYRRLARGIPDGNDYEYWYRADGEICNSDGKKVRWRPSTNMPKEAARIFLRVTDVRVERLQAITEEDAVAEGEYKTRASYRVAVYGFSKRWDSRIKKSDLHRYGWAANPWVWRIEFEMVSKETVENE